MEQSSPSSNDKLPLAGLRVVALEQAVAAPFCSRQLADMGADVVKVERPDGGDFARSYDGALNGLSAYFAWLNRGKRSLTLDVKSEAGQVVMEKLLEIADVFIHNLAPGAVERLGWGYEKIKKKFPRLVWVGISGYGPDGPYREKKAYDMLIQAEASVVNITGTPEASAKVGISIADIAAGLYGYASILTALLNRDKTGRGERINISMFECMTEWMMPPIYVLERPRCALGYGAVPKEGSPSSKREKFLVLTEFMVMAKMRHDWLKVHYEISQYASTRVYQNKGQHYKSTETYSIANYDGKVSRDS